jgi:hypothetical protein
MLRLPVIGSRSLKSVIAALSLLVAAPAAAADAFILKVGVLRQEHSRETASVLDIPAADDTLAGALLGAAENNTTGKFTNQTFEAIDEKLDEGVKVTAAVDALADKGARLIIADLTADQLPLASERAKAKGALLLNVSATDDRLRLWRPSAAR